MFIDWLIAAILWKSLFHSPFVRTAQIYLLLSSWLTDGFIPHACLVEDILNSLVEQGLALEKVHLGIHGFCVVLGVPVGRQATDERLLVPTHAWAEISAYLACRIRPIAPRHWVVHQDQLVCGLCFLEALFDHIYGVQSVFSLVDDEIELCHYAVDRYEIEVIVFYNEDGAVVWDLIWVYGDYDFVGIIRGELNVRWLLGTAVSALESYRGWLWFFATLRSLYQVCTLNSHSLG